MMNEPIHIHVRQLLDRYDTILLDAYGVLVHSAGPLDGTVEFMAALEKNRKHYLILTNDASKSPSAIAGRFQKFGLKVDPDDIITSGLLLKSYFASHSLSGARCVLLGPPDSQPYVTDAGGILVRPEEDFDVLVICDETGFPFLETMDAVLSGIFHKLDRSENVHLILPNPDVIYPKTEENYGFASGSLALMIEAAVDLRYAEAFSKRFVRLGKPELPIFEEARKRCRTMNMVMIGDQLETDIQGANNFGIDSVLVSGGVIKPDMKKMPKHLQPTYLMHPLSQQISMLNKS